MAGYLIGNPRPPWNEPAAAPLPSCWALAYTKLPHYFFLSHPTFSQKTVTDTHTPGNQTPDLQLSLFTLLSATHNLRLYANGDHGFYCTGWMFPCDMPRGIIYISFRSKFGGERLLTI